MPITRFFFFSLLFYLPLSAWFFDTHKKPFTLMLEASGDSVHTGRIIDDNFESTIAFALAHAIKNRLQAESTHLTVILNRASGQQIAPLHNATIANRLSIDLYVSINLFAQSENQPTFFIYQLGYVDETTFKQNDLNFYPLDLVYLLHTPTTYKWASQIKDLLMSSGQLVKGPYKMPFKPLIGIHAPAIGLEIGIKNKNDWQQLIEPLITSLQTIIGNHGA